MSDEVPQSATSEPLPQSLGRALRREDFTAERARRIAEEALKRGGVPLMSEEARRASLAAARAAIPAGSDVWIFAYGSLMWNPAIRVSTSRRAHVRGYHRTFCLTMSAGRGSIDKPGLMLAIDRGGSCAGVAHNISADHVDSELTILWYREMLSGAYEPRWINAEIEHIGRARVLTFAINRSHPRYENSLSEDDTARRIATAEGILGSNREYLFRTAAHLAENGLRDAPLARLAARVTACMAENISTGD